MTMSDWREIMAQACNEPPHVERLEGTALCIQCPSWGQYPNLQADVTFLARSLGGHVDVCPATEVLVLVHEPDDAFMLAMELRELSAGVRLHVGMATGACAMARVQCSGRMMNILAGDVVEQAISACDLAPAGTFRMSPSTFQALGGVSRILAACMLQTEYEGDDIAAIAVTPPPLKGSGHLSSFAGLGLT
ncbi:hypothetical protein ACPWT1_20545 [Ramlibacter sp. MMS24-I3-19]|uniref:hypothetical protein n=1 Tax=Ramlibacter sp. MMS24-I3-19 TaxID=3416606 RepID=UPI003CFF95E4